jgi:general secretion pathway protein E
MPQSMVSGLCEELGRLKPDDPEYAARSVDAVLAAARKVGVSDVHFQPTGDGLELKYRMDGVLTPVAMFPAQLAGNITARLKVLSGLLTYHTDRPQEGRIRLPQDDVEMRVCTFPTLHGERTVVRLFGGTQRYQRLDDLGLPADVLQPLRTLLSETSGAVLVSGPAGSGKTTTVYACLREIAGGKGDSPHLPERPEGCFAQMGTVPFSAGSGARSLVSIEDPIEVAVDGVAQSQVHPPAGLDLAGGLRFLMRQDPEVIMVGEIRDRATADAALQASLTGHLLLSTFHAGSAAETVGRLLDMGIEPYVLRSGLLAILNQRLLRRLCSCAVPSDNPDARLGLAVERVMMPHGCQKCGGTGYQGRFLLVEMLTLSRSELARAILADSDTAVIERSAVEAGMLTRWQRACRAVDAGLTSPAEVRRVLGFSGG